MPGFGFRWGSQISSRFERSIRLMILPPFPTIGFSYSSRPMPSMHQAMEEAMAREMEALQDEEDAGEGQAENEAEGEAESAAEAKPLLRPLDVAVLSKVGTEVTERPGNDDDTTSSEDEEEEEAEQKESGGHFMLSAEATFDGMVQGMYMQRFNKNWSTRHMILTSMEPGRSMVYSSPPARVPVHVFMVKPMYVLIAVRFATVDVVALVQRRKLHLQIELELGAGPRVLQPHASHHTATLHRRRGGIRHEGQAARGLYVLPSRYALSFADHRRYQGCSLAHAPLFLRNVQGRWEAAMSSGRRKAVSLPLRTSRPHTTTSGA